MQNDQINYIDLGQRIRKARKSKNINQRMLAEKLGISTQHCSHIETGKTHISLPLLVKIANELDSSLDELLASSLTAVNVPHYCSQTEKLLREFSEVDKTELCKFTQMLYQFVTNYTSIMSGPSGESSHKM